jgi:hypothetical protein
MRPPALAVADLQPLFAEHTRLFRDAPSRSAGKCPVQTGGSAFDGYRVYTGACIELNTIVDVAGSANQCTDAPIADRNLAGQLDPLTQPPVTAQPQPFDARLISGALRNPLRQAVDRPAGDYWSANDFGRRPQAFYIRYRRGRVGARPAPRVCVYGVRSVY